MDIVIKYGVDIALIIVLISTVIGSMRKGFLKCVLSLLCVIVALAAATTFNEPVAEWCYDSVLDGIVTEKVEESMLNGMESIDAALTVESITQAIPQFLTDSIAELGIDISSVTKSIDSLDLSTHDTAQNISQQIIRPAALVLLRVLAYILIFVFVRFLTGIITNIFSGIVKLPVLRSVNKLLGAILGAVKGIVLVFSIGMLLNLFAQIIKNTDVIAQAIENSNICGIISGVDFTVLMR